MDAIQRIDARLKELNEAEIPEELKDVVQDEKEELEVYRKALQKKTPEEYIDLIGKLQDELHESSDEYVENRDKPESHRLLEKCDELERQIKQTYDEFFTTYPERKVMCWYCGGQGFLLNCEGMCSWCASK